MAGQTTNYTDIVSGVEALMGDSLTTTETSRLKHLINHRARAAYRAYDEWPEFLIIKEERRVNATFGSDENAAIADSTYALHPSVQAVRIDRNNNEISGENKVDTWIRMYKTEPYVNKSVTQYDFYDEDGDAYPVGYTDAYSENDTISLTSADDSGGSGNLSLVTSGSHNLRRNDSFALSGLTNATGTYNANGENWMVVSVTAGSNIVVAQRDGYSSGEANTYTLSSAKLKYPTVWVDYKTRLTATYGTGSGETSTVPRRWADYLIRGAYADLLRADGQSEKSAAEEMVARDILKDEIFFLERRQKVKAIGARIRTHTSSGSR